MRTVVFVYLVLLVVGVAQSPKVHACPFCEALAPCLREESTRYDFIVVATCKDSVEWSSSNPVCALRIQSVLSKTTPSKEDKAADERLGSEVQVYCNEAFEPGNQALLFGVINGAEVDWAPSATLSSSALAYVTKQFEVNDSVLSHTETSDQSQLTQWWMHFYWDHLESSDEWVRRDAYNALATVSIEGLARWSKTIDFAELKRRLSNKTTSVSHRRFYWTLLALAGSNKDAPFVRQAIMRQLDRQSLDAKIEDSVGLDAAISSFLALGGEEALVEVEKSILCSDKCQSSERFAAIAALRVHAEEFQVFEKNRICNALSLLLESPDSAGMIIPDLCRLEDWTHITTLKAKFGEAEDSRRSLRLAILNYLRTCPLPAAKTALEECRKLDPDAFRSASIMFPFRR